MPRQQKKPQRRAQFLTSAVRPEQYPAADRAEVAIAGRSNAGKSTLINSIYGGKVAKVSATPGKTILLNFFDIGAQYRMVDMPGYGFAARNPKMVEDWKSMIETYISCRANLVGLLLVMDIRRDWSEEEELLVAWLRRVERPVIVVATKADKMSRSRSLQRVKELRRQSKRDEIFATSTKEAQSYWQLEEQIYRSWVRT